jgi:hypothetical protein
MRCSLIAFFVASSLGTPIASAALADRPIPQDAGRMEQRRRDRLEWNRRTLVGAYDKVGRKDARWDKNAREALEAAARMHARQVDPVCIYQGSLFIPAQRAVDAGCDDPLILYISARGFAEGSPEQLNRIHSAATALVKSSYPRFRIAGVIYDENVLKTSQKNLSPEGRREAEKGFESILSILPLSVAQDERTVDWEDRWFFMLDIIMRTFNYFHPDLQAAFDRVDARLAKIPELKALRLRFRGNFLIAFAWEARTTAFAPQVTEEGFRKFTQRLTEARKILNQAWAASPDNARTAYLMLAIEKGIGGDRDAMEIWFERALKADGDFRDACWAKMDWLDPKWHGSKEEMLAFSRACRDTKNYHEGITLLWPETLLRLAPAEVAEMLAKPEPLREIKAVYEEYLKHYLFDFAARSNLAALCYLAGDYVEADKQFRNLGTSLRGGTNIPLATMRQFRDAAAQHVKDQPK